MIVSMSSANYHPTCNHHVVPKMEEENESHSLPTCPYGQGSKGDGYRLSLPYRSRGQEIKGRLLEAVSGCLNTEYFIEYLALLRSSIKAHLQQNEKIRIYFFTIHIHTYIFRITNLSVG